MTFHILVIQLLRFQVHAELSGLTKVLEPLARIALRARKETLLDMKKYVERAVP